MPTPRSNQILGLQDTVFALGYLYGTQGSASGAFTDDVPFGEVENVSYNIRTSLDFVNGPESLHPLGASATARSITIRGKNAKIRARYLQTMLGGSGGRDANGVPPALVYTSSAVGASGAFPALPAGTRLPIGGSDDYGPIVFKMHFKTPSDGSDVELYFYACVSEDLTLDFALRKYVMPDFSAVALYDPNTQRVGDIFLPTDQHTN